MVDFSGRYGPWALVAGGSEGLGAAFAVGAASRGLHVVLVARHGAALEEQAALLAGRYRVQVRTVVADLGEPQTTERTLPAATAGLDVGLVVANAAYAPVGPFLELADDAVEQALRVNCQAPVGLARHYLPPMVARRRGGLVIVSSAAGLQGVPRLAAYSATKAFGRTLAESLWAELRPYGVDVLGCVAGAVATPGLRRSGLPHPPGTVSPERVVQSAYAGLGRGPTVVPGVFMRVATATTGLLPRGAAVRLMGRSSAGLTPSAPDSHR